MYKKRSFCLLLYFTVFLLGLMGCKGSDSETPKVNLTEDFTSYYKENISTTVINSKISICNLKKEDTKENPKIVLILQTSDEVLYQWMHLLPQERKSELKAYADIVTQYTKDREWPEDYYLYVTLLGENADFSPIYDFEENILYTQSPKVEEFYMKMYEKYGTLNLVQAGQTQGGKYLISSYGFGYYENRQFWLDLNLAPYLYGPYINIIDGKFYGPEGDFGYYYQN